MAQRILLCTLLWSWLVGSSACGGGGSPTPSPSAAPAAPAEPVIDRLTLLKEAQARTKAEREKKREQLRSVAEATITKKKKVGKKKDVKLELAFELTNKGDKELQLAEGSIEIRDGSDKLIKNLRVPFEGPIKPGEKAKKQGKFPVDPGQEDDVALVRTELAELKVSWVPKRYRFADGTELISE